MTEDMTIQKSMFKCVFSVYLPLFDRQIGQDGHQLLFPVAEFDFDPGLEINTEIHLQDICLIEEKTSYREDPPFKFTFNALVIDKKYKIRAESNDNTVVDKLELTYILEIADKDIIPEMVRKLISKFPSYFEKLPIASE
jgi:hypothetical protein